MELFFAQTAGIIFLAIGLGFVLNKKHYEKLVKSFFGNEGLIYLGGFMSLLLGMLMLSAHSTLSLDLMGVFALFGYSATIKGFFLLATPTMYKKMAKHMMKCHKLMFFMSYLLLVLGIYFVYLGFFA